MGAKILRQINIGQNSETTKNLNTSDRVVDVMKIGLTPDPKFL